MKNQYNILYSLWIDHCGLCRCSLHHNNWTIHLLTNPSCKNSGCAADKFLIPTNLPMLGLSFRLNKAYSGRTVADHVWTCETPPLYDVHQLLKHFLDCDDILIFTPMKKAASLRLHLDLQQCFLVRLLLNIYHVLEPGTYGIFMS